MSYLVTFFKYKIQYFLPQFSLQSIFVKFMKMVENEKGPERLKRMVETDQFALYEEPVFFV